MLGSVLCDICQCEALWTPAKIIDDAAAASREQAGDDKVILGLSGGVDLLLTPRHRAIGKNLTCVFVLSTGVLCRDEAEQVLDMFGDHFGLHCSRTGRRLLPVSAGWRKRSGSKT